MCDKIGDILTGLFTNGLWDLIKILLGGITGWFGHKYYNKISLKGSKNMIKQKGKGNLSEVEGDDNYIDQSK